MVNQSKRTIMKRLDREAERHRRTVLTMLMPMLNPDVTMEYDPTREGVLTLSAPGQKTVTITAIGDDATFLDINDGASE